MRRGRRLRLEDAAPGDLGAPAVVDVNFNLLAL
jgi:hypothetical protein